MLHAIAGGAAARPFITHHNTLDMQLYLRIALELHLKRLMVGGIERVYEIGRVFRNEGIDATHNPEFTMIEIYQAYGNYESMMDLTEDIIVNAARMVNSPEAGSQDTWEESLVFSWGEEEIDFTPPWPRLKYADLFREHAGCEMSDAAAVAKRAHELAEHGSIGKELIERMDNSEVHPDVVVNEVFEATVEHHLKNPTFVIDYPASICPLTKRKKGHPEIAERFELFVQSMELANAYTELNDPRLQEELFRTQLAGLPEEESMAKMDHDFIRALKVGMPPGGGTRHRHRPVGDAAHQQPEHSGCDFLPAAQTGRRAGGVSPLVTHEEEKPFEDENPNNPTNGACVNRYRDWLRADRRTYSNGGERVATTRWKSE